MLADFSKWFWQFKVDIENNISLRKIFGVLFLFIFFGSCTTDKKVPSEIAELKIELQIDRFDQAFARATENNWRELKRAYPYLFPNQYSDAFWEEKLSDTLQLEINEEVDRIFPNNSFLDEELRKLFKHIKYYYPKTTVPKIVAVTSEVEYRNKIILTDTLALVSLDCYLGKDHQFYGGISQYLAKNFRKERIAIDVAEAFVKTKVPLPQTFTFMEALIYEGKQLYLMEQLLSLKPIGEILGYTEDEYRFAQENEVNVWQYFVSKELLFSTDRKLLARFVNPAPFSKFYLELDNETPGRIGRYIGYQIVKSYMDKNNLPIDTMLAQNAELIFNNAKYKP